MLIIPVQARRSFYTRCAAVHVEQIARLTRTTIAASAHYGDWDGGVIVASSFAHATIVNGMADAAIFRAYSAMMRCSSYI